MGVDKEYIIKSCQDKQTLYGIDICMLQTEPCKRAVEMDRCPKLWEFYRMTDSEKSNNCEPQTYVINPQEPTNDDKCFECDDFFTCGGQCNKVEDEPTGYNLSPVKDEPQTCSVNGRPYDCGNCEYHKCTADEPQTERSK